jgi:hypothetical protein
MFHNIQRTFNLDKRWRYSFLRHVCNRFNLWVFDLRHQIGMLVLPMYTTIDPCDLLHALRLAFINIIHQWLKSLNYITCTQSKRLPVIHIRLKVLCMLWNIYNHYSLHYRQVPCNLKYTLNSMTLITDELC